MYGPALYLWKDCAYNVYSFASWSFAYTGEIYLVAGQLEKERAFGREKALELIIKTIFDAKPQARLKYFAYVSNPGN